MDLAGNFRCLCGDLRHLLSYRNVVVGYRFTPSLGSHCDMPDDPEYRSRWQLKKKWYRDNGVFPYSEGAGPNGNWS